MNRRPSKQALTALACIASGALGFATYKYYIQVMRNAMFMSVRLSQMVLIRLFKNQQPTSLVHRAATKPSQWLTELPTREQQVEALSKTPEYDILVIGGGATGAGRLHESEYYIFNLGVK